MGLDQSTISLMHMFNHAVFCVENRFITCVNAAAEQLSITPGTSVEDLIESGREEYSTFHGGALSLTLNVAQNNYIATVLEIGDAHIFHLLSKYDSEDLRSMALAAQNIREPLAGIMGVAERITQNTDSTQNAILNKNAYRILRLLNNMSDAAGAKNRSYNMEVLDLSSVLNEIAEASIAYAENTGNTITYKGLQERVYTRCDRDMLERAFYNLLSNAIKYSPNGSAISITVTRKENKVLLSIQNPCENIINYEIGTMFFRYRRDPGLEDPRSGVGLGIPMVCAAAAAHKGTLLFSQDSKKNITFTLSVKIISESKTMRSPITYIDYAGGRNHALLELSDVLPTALYE